MKLLGWEYSWWNWSFDKNSILMIGCIVTWISNNSVYQSMQYRKFLLKCFCLIHYNFFLENQELHTKYARANAKDILEVRRKDNVGFKNSSLLRKIFLFDNIPNSWGKQKVSKNRNCHIKNENAATMKINLNVLHPLINGTIDFQDGVP